MLFFSLEHVLSIVFGQSFEVLKLSFALFSCPRGKLDEIA
jgi:hypothetical protein